jgi:hypothetical protein
MVKRTKWEGSAGDRKADAHGAKRRGISVGAYERTTEDRKSDKRAQKKTKAKK